MRDKRLSSLRADAGTVEAALGGYRVLRRRHEDWEHIGSGCALLACQIDLSAYRQHRHSSHEIYELRSKT